MTSSPVWHPFTQHGLGDPIPYIERGEGARLFDRDGNSWIDAISSWWVTTHGHCNPQIMQAIRDQTEKLDQLIFAGWTHEPAETLARSLVEITPAPLQHVFFSDSGSTSVEVALKMALGFFANRDEKRNRILVMENSYHGDTIGAMSVGARGVFNQAYSPLLFDVGTIPFPAAGQEQATLDALEAACKEKPAAFIVEPLILGAGGMLIYSVEVLREMRDICTRHDVLFIADEVMTGWGRTGERFACDHAAITPDIMCLSKGLTGGAIPLAVTLSTRPIFDAHYSKDRSKTFFHSSSYTANPIACAAANANLDIWKNGPVESRISALCDRQSGHLARLIDNPYLTNHRQLGTITAMDVVGDGPNYLSDIGPRLAAYFRNHGLLIRPLGNVIYTMPPYCISDDELTSVYDGITAALDELLG